MNVIRSAVLIAGVVLLPACGASGAKYPGQSNDLNLAQHLERKTVAMVHWIGDTGEVDEDGDKVRGEVDPTTHPEAELTPYCSGVWVSKDTFVTAQHCVQHLGHPKVDPINEMLRRMLDIPDSWDPTGQPAIYSSFGDVEDKATCKVRNTHTATVLANDPDHDLALVKVDAGAIPHHEIAELATNVRTGDEAHIVGHPAGMWWTYIKGVVAAVRPNCEGPSHHSFDAVHVSAPVFFGNSGGGAFNQDGQLIGISSWIRRVPNTAFFVKFDYVSDLLKKNNVTQ